MTDLKKQIIFSEDAEFMPEDVDRHDEAAQSLRGPIYFSPDEVVLDDEPEQVKIQGAVFFDEEDLVSEGKKQTTIYPDGVTFNVADLKPAATFNAVTGEIEFIEENQGDKKQDIKPVIIIDGPNPK
jgi:hypothetical protein|tara:strand:+ start:86 stop:463 length:378 start_codon:yes stop_codon:yes gene_type:complete